MLRTHGIIQLSSNPRGVFHYVFITSSRTIDVAVVFRLWPELLRYAYILLTAAPRRITAHLQQRSGKAQGDLIWYLFNCQLMLLHSFGDDVNHRFVSWILIGYRIVFTRVLGEVEQKGWVVDSDSITVTVTCTLSNTGIGSRVKYRCY